MYILLHICVLKCVNIPISMGHVTTQNKHYFDVSAYLSVYQILYYQLHMVNIYFCSLYMYSTDNKLSILHFCSCHAPFLYIHNGNYHDYVHLISVLQSIQSFTIPVHIFTFQNTTMIILIMYNLFFYMIMHLIHIECLLYSMLSLFTCMW